MPNKDACIPKELREDYTVGEVLGNGAFGEVLEIVPKHDDGPTFAMKKIARKTSAEDEQIRKEIDILSSINHPFIVKYIGYGKTRNDFSILMEFANGGTLEKFIMDEPILSERTVKNYFYQSATAIKYLHQNSIMHRDLKPANILMHQDNDGRWRVKVSDFGLSKEEIRTDYHSICGTLQYMAPEVKLRGRYSNKADVWSLGLVLYFMLNEGALPKGAVSRSKIKMLDASKNARRLLKKMLEPDYTERIDSDEIKEQPWIAEDSKVRKIVKTMARQAT